MIRWLQDFDWVFATLIALSVCVVALFVGMIAYAALLDARCSDACPRVGRLYDHVNNGACECSSRPLPKCKGSTEARCTP